MFQLNHIKYKGILNIESLHIAEQEVTCIVGESGSGKTTLLKLLNKLISPDSGEILLDGQSLKEIDSISLRRRVVMLPQTPTIFSGTIKDNLLLGRNFSDQPMVSDHVLEEMLQMVRLNKELDQSAANLSGGEKQRLALGRVLLMSPHTFLLDEPSSALDEETEELIIDKLVQYSKDHHKTLIMVTHSKSIAHRFGDRIFEVKNGSIL